MRGKNKQAKPFLDYVFPDIVDSLKQKISTCRFPDPEYDIKGRKIVFAGVNIGIPYNSDQELLCQTLFKNKLSRNREWSWDEVIEGWGDEISGQNQWRRVYNAGREINSKVAMETTLKDLLVVKKYSIAVNSKYVNS